MTNIDLEKFEQFRRKFDPSFAKTSSNTSNQQGPQIKWPNNNEQAKKSNDDDDLYS